MLSILFFIYFFMEIILILVITNVIIVIIVFVRLAVIMRDLSLRLLQIEVIKKAESFEQAEDFGKKDIKSIQEFDAKITDVQEKAFIKATKQQINWEEEIPEWEDWLGKK